MVISGEASLQIGRTLEDTSIGTDNRKISLSEGVECLQARIGFTLPVSAHLRTVTDQLRAPTIATKSSDQNPGLPQRVRTSPCFQTSKGKKGSTTTQDEANGALLFRPQAELSTPSHVAHTENHALDPRHLKNARGDDVHSQNDRNRT